MRSNTRINILAYLMLTAWWPDSVLSAGNVGCLFSQQVCETEEECFDDNAFGRCQSLFDSETDEFYKHSLGSETVKLLEKELSRLFAGGYHWTDDYTQCVVQNVLYATRYKIAYDPGLCSKIMQLTLPEVPKELVPELEEIAPNELARIKFSPNRDKNEDVIYADENFTPPLAMEKESKEEETRPDTTEFVKKKKKYWSSTPTEELGTEGYADQGALFHRLLEDTEKLFDVEDDFASRLPGNEVPVVKTSLSSDMTHRPIFTEGGVDWIPTSEEEEEKQAMYKTMHRDAGIPPMVLGGQDYDGDTSLIRLDSSEDKPSFMSFDEDSANDNGASLIQAVGRGEDSGESEPEDDDTTFRWNWRYQEPGAQEITVNGPKPKVATSNRKPMKNVQRSESDYYEDNLHAVLPIDGGMPTFQRPMRYDIKKPGPTYSLHDDEDGVDYSDDFLNGDDMIAQLMKDAQKNQLEDLLWRRSEKVSKSSPAADEIQENAVLDEVFHIQYSPLPTSKPKTETEKPDSENGGDDNSSSKKRTFQNKQADQEMIGNQPYNRVQYPVNKEVGDGHTQEDHKGKFESVDTTHTYILIKQSSASKEQGEKLVKALEKLLRLSRGTFSNIRTDGNQVTFKVNPNNQGLNASDVASKAEELASDLKKETQLTVESAGIGDKVKYEVLSKESDRKLFILTFVLCGSVVGVLLAVAVAYIVRRHARSKKKLQNLSQPDTEASQDYQDLCRQRMASKTSEGSDTVHAAFSPKKMRSLSQGEGPASSSSHSSTSSWNEEPVTSNMDISTGHMILAYMEDHLKNKDRLDREWEALCAYEAEPCSTAAATLPQNMKKNRYPDVLPYDHSRVILNVDSNVSGSDYINASSITDHDPRNPAYIATQGPLPHTAADFWQMIWEQGSVVMVMLTRLMENGVAMCHRHWPEEGSEVYHIYEVHLVSEHIWCDDYLVRSFYLKNLRTGETRTVTQFHFLSWPDNGVPSSAKALLEFRRKVNKSYRGRSCPIVVHCSDGIGRTGTYILIDMVLNRMAKGAKEIDIAATLEHVRDQRAGMVKTKAQFEFVLMAIAEEVHAILKALSQ